MRNKYCMRIVDLINQIVTIRGPGTPAAAPEGVCHARYSRPGDCAVREAMKRSHPLRSATRSRRCSARAPWIGGRTRAQGGMRASQAGVRPAATSGVGRRAPRQRACVAPSAHRHTRGEYVAIFLYRFRDDSIDDGAICNGPREATEGRSRRAHRSESFLRARARGPFGSRRNHRDCARVAVEPPACNLHDNGAGNRRRPLYRGRRLMLVLTRRGIRPIRTAVTLKRQYRETNRYENQSCNLLRGRQAA
jgi:hypothetical protein